MDKPRQRALETFQSYFYRVKDFIVLQSFIMDCPTQVNSSFNVDMLIAGATYKDDIKLQSCLEQNSKDPEMQQRYDGTWLMSTLSGIVDSIVKSKHLPLSSQHRMIKFCLRSPSRSHSSRTCSMTSSLTSAPSAVAVNLLQDFARSLYDDPDLPEDDSHIVLGINAVAHNSDNPVRTFDCSKLYAVCYRARHSFKDCPLLNDDDWAKKQMIQLSLFCDRLCCSRDRALQDVKSVSKVASHSEQAAQDSAVLDFQLG